MGEDDLGGERGLGGFRVVFGGGGSGNKSASLNIYFPPLPPAKTPIPLPPLPHANSSIQTYQTNNIERPTNALFAFMFFFFFFEGVIARAGRGMQDKELGLDVLDVSFFGWGGEN